MNKEVECPIVEEITENSRYITPPPKVNNIKEIDETGKLIKYLPFHLQHFEPQDQDLITDRKKLSEVSNPVGEDEPDQELITNLLKTWNKVNALGLSAIQINISKRVFIAKLSEGCFVFVNPRLRLDANTEEVLSQEGCLSIPGCLRRIKRHKTLVIDADNIYNVDKGLTDIEGPIECENLDAFVIQHEIDHLNGVLITDHEEVLNKTEICSRKRQTKILKARQDRKSKKEKELLSKLPKISEKRQKQLKKQHKQEAKRFKKCVEIQERFEAETQHLFD